MLWEIQYPRMASFRPASHSPYHCHLITLGKGWNLPLSSWRVTTEVIMRNETLRILIHPDTMRLLERSRHVQRYFKGYYRFYPSSMFLVGLRASGAKGLTMTSKRGNHVSPRFDVHTNATHRFSAPGPRNRYVSVVEFHRVGCNTSCQVVQSALWSMLLSDCKSLDTQ
jgi:hypothetical protein